MILISIASTAVFFCRRWCSNDECINVAHRIPRWGTEVRNKQLSSTSKFPDKRVPVILHKGD